MSFVFIEDAAGAARLESELRSHGRLALDCEAAGFHRYSDRLCLVQISTPDRNYILDTLAFDPSDRLRPVLEDPNVEIVVHGVRDKESLIQLVKSIPRTLASRR